MQLVKLRALERSPGFASEHRKFCFPQLVDCLHAQAPLGVGSRPKDLPELCGDGWFPPGLLEPPPLPALGDIGRRAWRLKRRDQEDSLEKQKCLESFAYLMPLKTTMYMPSLPLPLSQLCISGLHGVVI